MTTANANTIVEQARTGIECLEADDGLKKAAIENLERWLTEDTFSSARPQLERLVERGRFLDLFDAFYQHIPFGTGGRRGRVGFGTNRLNPFSVSTSIQGHCEFLKKHYPGEELSVVIAYDVRIFTDLKTMYDSAIDNPLLDMTSLDLARVAAEVYAANDVHVWFNSPDATRYISTPELSFAIRKLGAHGGLNISASHNHPDDNGAKIYNRRGGQEIPPLDEEMATIVESIERAESLPFDDAVEQGKVQWIPANVHDEYVATNAVVSLDANLRSAKIVFTPLHGTGWSSVGETLKAAGFDVECYSEQAEPDGRFPTVPFRSPNPEVEESLVKATEHAESIGADLVLAADPDADRLGMVVPDPTHGWSFVNGNVVGVLLADYMARGGAAEGKENPFCVTTVVTTSLFRRIAESTGMQCVSDLPIGFKYIADVLKRIEDDGVYDHVRGTADDFVVGIEESHGYLVLESIRDKDAAGAAVLISELISKLKDDGRSVLEHLDDIYARFGYVSNVLRSNVMEGADGRFDIEKIQDSLRENQPTEIHGLAVEKFVDRWDTEAFGEILSETDRASRDLQTLYLENDVRIVLRPSGTEPKNKCYVEVCDAPLGEGASPEAIAERKREVDQLARAVARSFLLEILSRVDIRPKPWTLDVSDLVPIRRKVHFGDTFVPELLRRLHAGETGAELEQWVDRSLEPYGSDGRLLVRGGVVSFLAEAGDETAPGYAMTEAVRDELARLFAV